jgi:carbon storage regulator
MLILTRRPRESIIIGHHIKIKVLSIDGNQIRLGIEAPPEIDIHRKEVYDRKKAEKAELDRIEANRIEAARFGVTP